MMSVSQRIDRACVRRWRATRTANAVSKLLRAYGVRRMTPSSGCKSLCGARIRATDTTTITDR
jgi:hypothetical protein